MATGWLTAHLTSMSTTVRQPSLSPAQHARQQVRDPAGRYATTPAAEAADVRGTLIGQHAQTPPAGLADEAIDYLTDRHPELDTAQAGALWERLVRDQAQTLAPDEPGQPAVAAEAGPWRDYCLSRAAALDDRDPAWADRYRLLAPAPPPARQAAAFQAMPRAGHRAVEQLHAETYAAASLAGVAPGVAASRVAALRAQYATELAHLPAHLRPDPPADWVHGFTHTDGSAARAPHDPATLYALYRVQADVSVFTDDERLHPTYASVDLETAAPVGPSGFKPKNGSIIEVAVLVYDDAGREQSRYEQLVRPCPDALAAYGTGMVEVHGITVDDLTGCPSWEQVAASTRQALTGHHLLAQNASFERKWLGHHLAAAGQPWDHDGVGSDTLRIAQQHYSGLENHRLPTICEAVGVAYTDGHRAAHDAEVTAAAFFRMREQIRARCAADPRFAAQPGWR